MFYWGIQPINIITELLSFACKKMERNKKWLVVSVSAPQSHMGLTQFLKLWPKLCLLRRLNRSRSFVSNLIPTRSCIRNNHLWFKEKTFFSIDLNCLIDSASGMVLSNLFHYLTQKGKKECLKLSVLQEKSCKLFLFPNLVW